MGNRRVCRVTRERARLHGIEPAELVARNDIDQLNDLQFGWHDQAAASNERDRALPE